MWTTIGVPARRAAIRPRMPALDECVCTTSYRPRRMKRESFISATRSVPGAIGRTSSSMRCSFTPSERATSWRLPSGPLSIPASSVTSKPGVRDWPTAVSSVFSWAPPTMRRVMMWRMRRSLIGQSGTVRGKMQGLCLPPRGPAYVLRTSLVAGVNRVQKGRARRTRAFRKPTPRRRARRR